MKKYLVKITYEHEIEVEAKDDWDACHLAVQIDNENGNGGDWCITAEELEEE